MSRLVVVLVAGAVLTGGAGLLGTGAALAAEWTPVPETGTPGELVLDSDPSPLEALDLSPGDPAFWQVRTRVDGDDRVSLSLRLRKAGALVTHPEGLRLSVASCATAWRNAAVAPTCANPAHLVSTGPADDLSTGSASFVVPNAAPDGRAYLSIELAVADTPQAAADRSLMGLTASVGIGLTATAADSSTVLPTPIDTPSPTESAGSPPSSTAAAPLPARLAFTGSAVLGPALLGAAIVLLGVAARVRAARRPAADEGSS